MKQLKIIKGENMKTLIEKIEELQQRCYDGKISDHEIFNVGYIEGLTSVITLIKETREKLDKKMNRIPEFMGGHDKAIAKQCLGYYKGARDEIIGKGG